MLSVFESLRTIDNPELLLTKEPLLGNDLLFHVFWKDLQGVYLGANDTQAKTYGLQKGEEVRGATDHDFLLNDLAVSLQRNDQRVVKEGTSKVFMESGLLKANKNVIAFSHKKPFFSKSKKVLGSLGFAFLLEDSEMSDLSFLLDPLGQQPFLTSFKKKLSPRQVECLVCLIKGKTFKQIAHELDLSSRTIEHYVQTLKTKLSVYSRSDLIAKGLELVEIRERL